jgi:hypothetical protein
MALERVHVEHRVVGQVLARCTGCWSARPGTTRLPTAAAFQPGSWRSPWSRGGGSGSLRGHRDSWGSRLTPPPLRTTF